MVAAAPFHITIIGHRGNMFFGLIIRSQFDSVHQSVGLGNVSTDPCCVIIHYFEQQGWLLVEVWLVIIGSSDRLLIIMGLTSRAR